MSGSERFSVNNTQIRRFTADGKAWVEKTIRCNAPLAISLDMLMGYMDAYRGELGGVGVAMPAIADGRVEGDSITYICEDGGRNLVELYETPHTLVHDHPDVLSGVIEILRRVAAAGLCIDPHIKNFTGEGTNLRYVDFSPPLVEPYIEARCSVAEGDEELRILRENFSYFTPRYLPYHFAGDFLNVDRSADSLFPALHVLLTNAGLLRDVGFAEFESRARAIRDLEDLRLQKRIFMI